VSDIDTAVVDSLKALDPERPIREADKRVLARNGRYWTKSGQGSALRRDSSVAIDPTETLAALLGDIGWLVRCHVTGIELGQ